MSSPVERFFAPIVPLGAALRGGRVGPKEIGLFESERAAVANAAPFRRREYAAGRRFARRALHAVGGPYAVLPPDADRAPVWPEGFVGSITHSQGEAAAIAASRSKFASLGLDLETIADVPLSLAERIATARERVWIGDDGDTGLRLALIFSAKEAWQKGQFPFTRHVFDFREINVSFDFQKALFQIGARPEQTDGRAPSRGRFAFDDRRVATIVARDV